MSDILYKKIIFKSSSAGTEEAEYFEPQATVADVLAKFSVSPDKVTIDVDGVSVDTGFVPVSGNVVTVSPKNYSSGAR